jgi:hypothetical protein
MGDEIVLGLDYLSRLAPFRVAALDKEAALLRVHQPIVIDVPALDALDCHRRTQAVGAQHARQFLLHGKVIP